MPAPKTNEAKTDAPAAASNGRPQRKVLTTGIPGRAGKPRVDLSAWQSEVDDLRNNLGSAFAYEGTSNANNLARQIQAQFGIVAKVRNWDKKNLVGDLYLEFPSKDENGKLVPDMDAVSAQIEKYSR